MDMFLITTHEDIAEIRGTTGAPLSQAAVGSVFGGRAIVDVAEREAMSIENVAALTLTWKNCPTNWNLSVPGFSWCS